MPTDLEQTFRDFLKEQYLKDQKLLLSVSGGIDSMVLFHVAVKTCLPTNLAVFHLDHSTRPESAREAQFIKSQCEAHQVKFYGFKLEKEEKKPNQEKHWRDQRIIFAHQAKTSFGAQSILTAHHATDLVETMIFRLTKGCGSAGLSPFDTNTKPFWRIPKSVFFDYGVKNKITWKEDPSNQDLSFQRNLIRQKILPELRKITPNLEKVFVQESEIFRDTNNFLSTSISHFKKVSKDRINFKDFKNMPSILQSEFIRSIAKKTPSYDEIRDCLKWLNGNPKGNSYKEIGDTRLSLQGKQLIWEI